MNERIPKILITAYAVNPYKGSEDGTGWNMIQEIAKYNNVIAITRKNNRLIRSNGTLLNWGSDKGQAEYDAE